MAQKSLSKGKRLKWEPMNKVVLQCINIKEIKGEKVFSKPVRLLIE